MQSCAACDWEGKRLAGHLRFSPHCRDAQPCAPCDPPETMCQVPKQEITKEPWKTRARKRMAERLHMMHTDLLMSLTHIEAAVTFATDVVQLIFDGLDTEGAAVRTDAENIFASFKHV